MFCAFFAAALGRPVEREGARFRTLAFFLFAMAVAASCFSRGVAAEYKHSTRHGSDTVVIPQDETETKRLFGDGYQYLNRNHLVLVSDLDQRTLTQLELRDFQAYLAILTRQMFTKALSEYHKDNTALPVVFLFKDRDSFIKGLRDMGLNAMLDRYLANDNLRGGYQLSTSSANCVLVNYRDNYDQGLATYIHELTHALVGMEYPKAPMWLNEGMATMLGDCRIEGGQLQYVHDGRITRLKRGVRDGGILSLAHLFALTNSHFSGKDHIAYYDAAGTFCRYLHAKDLLVPVYLEMRDGRGKGVNGSDTVARIAGRSLVDLEKDWHAWLKEQGKR